VLLTRGQSWYFIPGQCCQIGQHITTWATLGYLLLKKYLPEQTVSKHGLMQVFKGFKSGLMLMFQEFKLRIDVYILPFWLPFPKLGRDFIQFSGRTVQDHILN
jgi:hypothetical protein